MRMSVRCPQAPEEVLTLALSSFPRLMPWEVAIACNIHADQSTHLSQVGSHDRALYVVYLRQLLGNQGSPVHQSIVKEVFESDADLLTLSLLAVLEEAGHPYDHTHTEDGRPKAGSHMIQWEDQQCLEFLVGICSGIEVKERTEKGLSLCQKAGYVLTISYTQMFCTALWCVVRFCLVCTLLILSLCLGIG